MAAHSSILAWESLWTEEPGGLQSMGSQELDMTKQLSVGTRPKGTALQPEAAIQLHLVFPETSCFCVLRGMLLP